MLADGATHVGVATDHVIESFRNELWPGYKTGDGIDPALRSQFESLEWALGGTGGDGVADGRARGRRRAGLGRRRWPPTTRRSTRCVICTPDKDLAQCVVGERVVQLDRRKGTVSDEAGVWDKFGVAPRPSPTGWPWSATPPTASPDWPDGESGRPRSVLAHYGSIDDVPDDVGRVGSGGAPGGAGCGQAGRPTGRRAGQRPSCSGTWPPCGWTPPCSDGRRPAGGEGRPRSSTGCAGTSGTGTGRAGRGRPGRLTRSHPGAEDLAELGRHRGVELGVGARRRGPVRPPPDETRWRGGSGRPGGGRRPPRPPARAAAAPS